MRRIVLTDLDRGTVHDFRDADIRIGRDPGCELPVVEAPASAEIAGVHARLVARASGWCLTDGRTNSGTYVNHIRLVGADQAILRSGDIIRLGSGAGARRYRVARVEISAAPKRQHPTPGGLRAVPPKPGVSTAQIAAGSAAGSAAATAAALVAANGRQALSSAGAAASSAAAVAAAEGALAATGGTVATTAATAGATAGAGLGVATAVGATVGAVGVGAAGLAATGGLENWRTLQVFKAAGGAGKATAAASAASATSWAGVAVGTLLVVGGAAGYVAMRPDVDADRRPILVAPAAGEPAPPGIPAATTAPPPTEAGAVRPAVGTLSVSTQGGPGASNAPPASPGLQRLAAAAASTGSVLTQVTAWYGRDRVRLTGVVLDQRGTLVTAADAVTRPNGATPDSVIALWPHGARHRATPVRVVGDGVAFLRLRDWSGQWLDPAAVSAPGPDPWAAALGFDADGEAVQVIAAEASVTLAGGALQIAGGSARLLPAALLVDKTGRAVGLWLSSSRAVRLPDPPP